MISCILSQGMFCWYQRQINISKYRQWYCKCCQQILSALSHIHKPIKAINIPSLRVSPKGKSWKWAQVPVQKSTEKSSCVQWAVPCTRRKSAVIDLFLSLGCCTCTCRREHPRLAKDSLAGQRCNTVRYCEHLRAVVRIFRPCLMMFNSLICLAWPNSYCPLP